MHGPSVPGASALTAAELRLLPFLCTHLSFPEIGEELFLSPNTIDYHLRHIFQKLGINNRIMLAAALQDRRWSGAT